MADQRLALIKRMETFLYGILDAEEAGSVVDELTVILGDYEVTERCTDLTVPDTSNERLLKMFCGCLVVDGKSEKTIYQYRRAAQKLADFVGKPFTEMGVYDIRFYLASEKQRMLSDRTIENQRACIAALFDWMAHEDMIEKNPMDKIKTIGFREEIKTAFSEVELDRLRGACETVKERAILETLLATGVRVSELCQMNITDIDAQALEVKVLHGKGDKTRKTFITPLAMSWVERYLTTREEQEEPALFSSAIHGRMTTGGIRAALNRIAERAGVENVHPHRFRRTFATTLARRGMDIREIQALLGHARIDTTLLYINTDQEGTKASYRKLVS